MRAHLRTLGACTLLVGMSVVSRASAEDTPPPADSVAARPPVVRFDDETPESHVPARLYAPTDARTEPGDGGQLVAHLPLGAGVTRLASRGSAVLVELDDPENGYTRLGWVPREAMEQQRWQLPARSSRLPGSVAVLERDKDYFPGAAVPPGFHTETRARLGMIEGGTVFFGGFYAVSALVAAASGEGLLLIPVVGPFLLVLRPDPLGASGASCGSTSIPSCAGSGLEAIAGRLALVVDGLAQAGGLLFIIVGLAAPKTILVRDRASARVIPMGRDGYGLGVVGSF